MATKVHRVRYYNPKPEAINCVSFNKNSKLLAVARGDASIEIWDLNYAPYIVKFIPGVENGSVEALGWVNDRLLSTGLGGALVEWDLNKLCLKTTVLLTGYAAWCLDVNPSNTSVAVGTEQGYINLYNVENDEIVYQKLFDKQEGRVLCCKFDNTGNILVTGSVNTIRIWNAETGHAIHRISVKRRGKEVIVWCLAVLSDNTLVSGDSHGRLTFWDTSFGDQIESYTTHKADILALTVSDDEKSIYCSGVDPLIIQFVKVTKAAQPQAEETQWVKSLQMEIHQHDVRGLAINGEKLISVGVDGYLSFSSYPPKWVMRIPPMIPSPRSCVSPSKKLVLLRYSNYLEIWKLGSYATTNKGAVMYSDYKPKNQDIAKSNIEQDTPIDVIHKTKVDKNSRSLKISDTAIKLATIHTKGGKQVRCCGMSPTGEFIVYSTDTNIRMLKLETDEEQVNTSLSKLLINGIPSCCERVAFTEDSRILVVYSSGTMYVLQVDPDAGATVVQTIATDKHLKTPAVLHLIISKRGLSGKTYLVVADTQGAITIWTQNSKKFEHYVSLPRYQCVPSAMAVDPRSERLIITYVDQKILEYDLVQKKFTDWPGALPIAWGSRKSAVLAVDAHPTKDAYVFQDEQALWTLDKKVPDTGVPTPKKKKGGKTHTGLNVVPIKYLAGFHWLGKDEAVSLEVLPENIVGQLPPTLAVKRHHNA